MQNCSSEDREGGLVVWQMAAWTPLGGPGDGGLKSWEQYKLGAAKVVHLTTFLV